MLSWNMSRLSDNRKFKFLVPLIVALVVVSVAVVALYGLVGTPNAPVNEVQNDLQVNVGSGYPGMVDMVSASIEKNQSTLNTTINVKEPVTALGEQESAQFDIIVILENGEDVLQTYELRVDINSTGTFGLVQDVQTKTQHPLQLQVDSTKLTITASLAELKDATKAEWNIYSTYEKIAGNEIISSAYDFIPDEGLTTTNFSTD
jgi:hypothetical protein